MGQLIKYWYVRGGFGIIGILSIAFSGYKLLNDTIHINTSISTIWLLFGENPKYTTLTYLISSLILLEYLVDIGFSILLLYGVHKNEETKWFPWLYYHASLSSVYVMFSIAAAIWYQTRTPLLNIAAPAQMAIILLILVHHLKQLKLREAEEALQQNRVLNTNRV